MIRGETAGKRSDIVFWNATGRFRGLCLCPAKSRFPTAETGVGSDSVIGGDIENKEEG